MSASPFTVEQALRPSGLSWRDGLHVLVPDGWPTTVSARASVDLALVADAVPLELTRAFYAEVRLDGSVDQADVSVEIARAERHAWRRAIASGALGAALQPNAEAWARIAMLLERWGHDARYDAAIAQMWVEFDRPVGVSQSAPSCFVGLNGADRSAAAWVGSLAQLLLPQLTAARRAALEATVSALPSGVVVGQLGVMLARGAEAPLRLCLAGVAPHRLDDTLRSVGVHAGRPQDALMAMLRADAPERLASDAPMIGAPTLDYVDLDVASECAARVGLELRFDRRSQARGVLRERDWLSHLAARGVVAPAWSRAVSEWPRGRRVIMPHQLWPSIAVRRLNHMKLVWERDDWCAAKGYCLLRTADAPSRRPAAGRDALPPLFTATSLPRQPLAPSARRRDVLATIPS